MRAELLSDLSEELTHHTDDTLRSILTALRVYRAGPEPKSDNGVSTAAGLCYADVAIMMRNCAALAKHGARACIGGGGKVSVKR